MLTGGKLGCWWGKSKNEEFSDWFNKLEIKAQTLVNDKLNSVKECPIQDENIKSTLVKMGKQYPVYIILLGLKDSDIYQILETHLESSTQYIHGYTNEGYKDFHFGTPYKYPTSNNLMVAGDIGVLVPEID